MRLHQLGRTTHYEPGKCGVHLLASNRPCGRPTFSSDPRTPSSQRCLLHSAEPKSTTEVVNEVEIILADARQQNKVADFTDVIFPELPAALRTIDIDVCFAGATFLCPVRMMLTQTLKADFRGAKFTKGANLR